MSKKLLRETNIMKKKAPKKRKINFRNICWGIHNIGGGNLDILNKVRKVPGICDEHQKVFIEIIECNDCNVRLS